MRKIIDIDKLTFRYKDQENRNAIDDLTLSVEDGEFLVILGPSGAGKSTLVNCLNGIIPKMTKGKYSGNVKVNGKLVSEETVSKMAKDIGLVFQDFENQLFSTNVKLEISFSPENFSRSVDEISEVIEEMLQLVGLKGFENREPSTLSGGQKQRLAIASVLAGKPSILCMDEPTTDLDPIGKLEVFGIAEKIRKDGKITLIIVEHETEEALLADKVLILNEGKIERYGAPKDILRQVDVFEHCGIMPLQVPAFYKKLGFSTKEIPLVVKEGIEFFKKNNLSINDTKYNSILAKEDEREKQYGETLIKVENLKHTYPNGFLAVNNMNIEVKEGEFLAVLGHNGSGKTTLVKHFNGLLKPTSGKVTVCGMDTSDKTIYEIGQKIGFAFQNPDHQIFSETVKEEVSFSPKLRGVPTSEIEERMKEALAAVDLSSYEESDPFTLSKGERQRVAVASILSARPKIIILDEPTTGLDYKEQIKMMNLVKKLNENGHTIIMITHSMWVVSEYAHKVAVVHNGEIVMYGRTRDVFSCDEELEKHYLRTPHIVNMSNVLGKTLLSINEFVSTVERGDSV